MIETIDLYKFYRAGENVVKALNGVTMKINDGEFCAIIGPSGSGKSTLLNMIAGLEPPTKGQIIINGEHVEKYSENELVAFRRKNVGFIFQSYNLIPTMSALENVAFPLMFKGVDKKTRLTKAAKYLDLVGLSDSMQNMGNAMSGGQQQRVGIARALAMDPKIIFADEPTGNLDTKSSAETLRLMKKIVEENGTTLIMVTHDPKIASFADRQIRIVDGMIDNSESEVV